MAQTVVVSRHRRWPRVIGLIFLVIILLLIALYFIVSSSAFFKGVILPRVSRSLNANVTVTDASIHPFSGVVFRDLKVQTTGPEPLLTASEVRVAYDFGAIVRGNYHIRDVELISPQVLIVTNPDGTSNLDPITKKSATTETNAPSRTAKSNQPSKTEQIALNRLIMSNATVRIAKNYTGGNRDLTELTNANIVLTNLANGQSGGLSLAANLNMSNNPPAPGTNATLQGVAAGNFKFTFSQDLKPVVLAGNAHFDVQKAGGSMSQVNGLSTILNCDVSPTDIKQVALQFQRNGGNLGGINLSGPFDMAKTEGHLKLEVTPIDKQVLDLLGASSGVAFGSTTLSSTNQLDFTNGGTMVTVSGQLNANKMALTRARQTTPALDLHSDYQLTVNRRDNSALLQSFNLNGTQNGQPLLRADLASPMNISFGGGANASVGDSALHLIVTNFNLAEWKAVLGNAASSGSLNATMNLLSQQSGKQLTVDFNSRLADVTAKVGTNQLQQASLNLQGHLVNQAANHDLSGNVTLANFNGKYEDYDFKDFGTKVDLDVAMNKPVTQLKSLTGRINQGTNDGGEFDATGNYNQDTKAGKLSLKFVNLNQNALRPFLGAFLGDKKLNSVSLNATTTADYASSGASSIKTDLQITNLVVTDPHGKGSPTPLALKFQLDASLNKQVAQVRQCVLGLAPTTNAPNNQITLSGQVDLSQTNAIQGSLKLASDSLDVTPYYDLYSKKTNATKPAPAPQNPAANPTQPAETQAANTEPAAKHLPFKTFTFDVAINTFYLHEVVISNLKTTARIDGSHLVMQPMQFGLNNGPVSATADVDVGVPGYQYNITFNGGKIPLAPLADTFSKEYKGRAKGELDANLQLKGAGTTGSNLQKNLAGQCNLSLTNANIQVVGSKSRKILVPIATALKLPELLDSPITWLTANVNIGNGTINVAQFKAQGSAFAASSQGNVQIANVLSNSPIQNLPVNFALAGPLATKAKLAPANAGTNQAYVDLGKIATVGGTIGDPKTKIDYVTLGVITARAVGGSGLIGGSAGKVLNSIGGLGQSLQGQHTGDSNQSTNTPQQNPPQNQPQNQPSGNPFDSLRKLIPK